MKLVFILNFILLNSAIGFTQFAEFNFLNGTNHQWERTKEGKQLEHYFVFENKGDVPLLIDEAAVSCSCTQVHYPKNPIPPQQKDSILVQFDTNQKYYQQDRIIKLKANTKKDTKLRVRVYVIPKDEEE